MCLHKATKSSLPGSNNRLKNTYGDKRRERYSNSSFVPFFTAAAHARGDVPGAPSVEDAYLARDDGNGKADEQTSEFSTSDIPIYCVVLLDRQRAVTVKINFVVMSVAGVKAETKVVTASYTTKDRQNRVNFTGRPEGKKLVFASNRNSAKQGDTNVFIADWVN